MCSTHPKPHSPSPPASLSGKTKLPVLPGPAVLFPASLCVQHSTLRAWSILCILLSLYDITPPDWDSYLGLFSCEHFPFTPKRVSPQHSIFKFLFTYLFVAVLGLHCCAWAALWSRSAASRVWCRASLRRSTWDLPGSGIEPVSPALEGRVFPTEPPWKPSPTLLCVSLRPHSILALSELHTGLFHSRHSQCVPTPVYQETRGVPSRGA